MTPISPLPVELQRSMSRYQLTIPAYKHLPHSTVRGVGLNTGPALPEMLKPSPEERTFQLVAFAIQSLELLSTHTYDSVEASHDVVKTSVLSALYSAMTTRAQQNWTTPFAILQNINMNNYTNINMGAEPGRQFESPEFEAWYEDRRRNSELGLVVDIACDLIEEDAVLPRREKRRPLTAAARRVQAMHTERAVM